jgi:putative molybdopterin biosynthesis protein
MRKSDTYLYQEIAESIRRQIASGELRPGDRLPPIRKLARRWNCTTGTVGRAYAVLAEEGLVVGQRGSGTRVTERPLSPQQPAWQWATLVNRAEQFLLEALGGGHTAAQAQTALTVAVSRWKTLQEEADAAEETAVSPPRLLRFSGSHDLVIDLLARRLRQMEPAAAIEINYSGSLGGLMALARGEADVAGVHLWDQDTDSYNLPFVGRLLPGRRVALLTLVHRSLGLILPPGNPQDLHTLADVAARHSQWMNRQPGSGTRVWLDARLRQAKIGRDALPGYEQEASTHTAVAQAVQAGKAAAGLGIHAAAAAYGLDFVPLTRERYELVMVEAVWQRPLIQTLRTILQSESFRRAVADLGGYDTAKTGQVRWLE